MCVEVIDKSNLKGKTGAGIGRVFNLYTVHEKVEFRDHTTSRLFGPCVRLGLHLRKNLGQGLFMVHVQALMDRSSRMHDVRKLPLWDYSM